MSNSNFSFINNLSQAEKNYNILILPQYLLYLSTHFRFSSAFPSTQLVDIMSYEVSTLHAASFQPNYYSPEASSIIVYNFHSLYSQDRFFVFTQPTYVTSQLSVNPNLAVSSVAEIYPAGN
jgi:hypothetical protein